MNDSSLFYRLRKRKIQFWCNFLEKSSLIKTREIDVDFYTGMELLMTGWWLCCCWYLILKITGFFRLLRLAKPTCWISRTKWFIWYGIRLCSKIILYSFAVLMSLSTWKNNFESMIFSIVAVSHPESPSVGWTINFCWLFVMALIKNDDVLRFSSMVRYCSVSSAYPLMLIEVLIIRYLQMNYEKYEPQHPWNSNLNQLLQRVYYVGRAFPVHDVLRLPPSESSCAWTGRKGTAWYWKLFPKHGNICRKCTTYITGTSWTLS